MPEIEAIKSQIEALEQARLEAIAQADSNLAAAHLALQQAEAQVAAESFRQRTEAQVTEWLATTPTEIEAEVVKIGVEMNLALAAYIEAFLKLKAIAPKHNSPYKIPSRLEHLSMAAIGAQNMGVHSLKDIRDHRSLQAMAKAVNQRGLSWLPEGWGGIIE